MKSIKPFITRRNFHQKMGLGLGALAFNNLLFTQGKGAGIAHQQKKLGIALVGLGNYSSGQLGPALQETSHCHLAGVVTGTPAKEKEWAEKYNIPTTNIYNYNNFDQIADNPDIDIVYVVLPNAMHAEYTIRAAEAGKHVICEKPMAVSVAECQQMIEACRQADVKLGIGYRLHSEPFNQEVMRIGQAEMFGKVLFINSSAGYKMGDNWDQWRLKMDLAGGGALMNMGIYAIQAALYTVGTNPIAVTAQEFKTMPEKFKEVDETITMQLEFPEGAIASLHTSHNAQMNRLYVAAEDGFAELQPMSSYRGLTGRTHEGKMNFPEVNQQAQQMDDFALHVLEGKPNKVPGEMGLRDMRIIEAVYESIASGKTIPLNMG